MATERARARGKAALEKFRSKKNQANEDEGANDDGEWTKVKNGALAPRRDGGPTSASAIDDGFQLAHDVRSGASEANEMSVSYVISHVNPFADADEDARGDGTRDAGDGTTTSDALWANGDAMNAYSALADRYSGVLNAQTSTEEVSIRGATTSTLRAREQYERVMRTLGNENAGDSIGVFARSEPETGESREKKAAKDAELVNAVVRSDDGATLAPQKRTTREDQSEIAMLQDVIDEMTKEKLNFMRGLQKSQAMIDELAMENDSLTQRYNETKSQLTRAKSELDDLWKEFQQISAKNNAVMYDRDSLSMNAVDANERVHALAAEVVNLEERLLEHDSVAAENKRLLRLIKEANSRRAHVELVLDATREEQRLFKEKIRDSELMRTLEKFDDDNAVFLCAWLMKKDPESEREVQAKADAKQAEENRVVEISSVVSGASASAEVDEEQMKLLTSINELLGELQSEKQDALMVKQQLLERNQLLESQLARTMRRLERGDDGDRWSDEEAPPTPQRRGGVFSYVTGGIFRRRR